MASPHDSQAHNSQDSAALVRALAEQVRRIEGVKRPASEVVISSGSGTLDRLLPEQGFRRGTLVEWLGCGPGSGAGLLALRAARQAMGHGGALVVVDRKRLFYPPAAVRLGIDLKQVIVVRPECDADHAWALDQVLRTRGVAAVWGESGEQDDHTLRRWQLAAESSGALGLLVRNQAARDAPSWAELRLLVEPIAQPPDRAMGRPPTGHSRRMRVTLLRCRTGQTGGAIELEISERTTEHDPIDGEAKGRDTRHETRTVHLASELAAAKTRRHVRRA